MIYPAIDIKMGNAYACAMGILHKKPFIMMMRAHKHSNLLMPGARWIPCGGFGWGGGEKTR